MKFEQLLQIYWSRGFLYGGEILPFNTNLSIFFKNKSGLAYKSQIKMIKRFEFNYFFKNKNETLINLPLNDRKVINMYLAQLSSINNNIFELIKYNLIRMYLIKTFKGRSYAIGKPANGQRTRSNASSANKCNKIIKMFINQVKKNNVIEKKPEVLNFKLKKKIKKKNIPKIKMVFLKKKKNLWF